MIFFLSTFVMTCPPKVSAVYDEGEFDVLLMGGGLWDALEIHEIDGEWDCSKSCGYQN